MIWSLAHMVQAFIFKLTLFQFFKIGTGQIQKYAVWGMASDSGWSIMLKISQPVIVEIKFFWLKNLNPNQYEIQINRNIAGHRHLLSGLCTVDQPPEQSGV